MFSQHRWEIAGSGHAGRSSRARRIRALRRQSQPSVKVRLGRGGWPRRRQHLSRCTAQASPERTSVRCGVSIRARLSRRAVLMPGGACDQPLHLRGLLSRGCLASRCCRTGYLCVAQLQAIRWGGLSVGTWRSIWRRDFGHSTCTRLFSSRHRTRACVRGQRVQAHAASKLYDGFRVAAATPKPRTKCGGRWRANAARGWLRPHPIRQPSRAS